LIVSLQPILDQLEIKINRYEPVHGGDINDAYCLSGENEKYFLKVNNANRYPGMFEKESRGLYALSEHLPALNIPRVIQYGAVEQQQYLLLQWIESGIPAKDFWESFGRSLALMHRQARNYFGWEEDNYIGNLQQHNSRHDEWHIFFSECRIMPLVRTLFNTAAFSKKDLSVAELFCRQSNQWFPNEPPALLHGDLWNGNYMISSTGYASVYDPAVYYGHREMDIGMTKLFGGFDQRFYDAYQEIYCMEQNWTQRLPLAQLYPLLVHAVLFGGHYVSSAREIITKHAG
jgi:fructosamine-3-kinase